MRHSGSEGFRELGIYDIFSVFFFPHPFSCKWHFCFFFVIYRLAEKMCEKKVIKKVILLSRGAGKKRTFSSVFFRIDSVIYGVFVFFRNLPGSGKDVREKSD